MTTSQNTRRSKPKPITGAEKARIRELHVAGASRNEIARQLGRSSSTISKICAQLGLSFDRTGTEVATAAKVADAKSRRADLMHRLLDDAERLREQLWAPATVYSFGGKDNTYNSKRVDRPPVRDQRDIMQSVSTAINASLKLDEHDADSGADEAKSMLGSLAAGLKAAYDQMQQNEPDASGGD